MLNFLFDPESFSKMDERMPYTQLIKIGYSYAVKNLYNNKLDGFRISHFSCAYLL